MRKPYPKNDTKNASNDQKQHREKDTEIIENCLEKMTQKMPETDPKFHRKLDTENAKKS